MNTISKYFLFVIFLSLSGNLFAQSFIKENKVWRFGSQVCPDGMPGPDCTSNNLTFKFQGDSIINDTIYTRLLISWNDVTLSNWTLDGLWRETEDKKIYVRSKNDRSPTEYMLYDFSLEKGDTLQLLYNWPFQVDSVLTKMWGGKMRKHWYLNRAHAEGDSANLKFSTLWIEDVGQVDYFPFSTKGYVGARNHLLCFYENGQQVYQNSDYNTCFYTSVNGIKVSEERFQLYPNPIADRLFIATNQSLKYELLVELYSMKGELILKECYDSGTNQFQINLNSIPSGSYVLRVMTEPGEIQEKVIIRR